MLASFSFWFGDINQAASPPVMGFITSIAAILCGAAVGIEREKREKPAGLRTLVLVCLGSAIFTQAGILLSTSAADKSRVAAQVVSGIGFLGAGAIIHDRGLIIGVTTGAAIWAIAAIGVMIGAGYVAAGVILTALILVTLIVERRLESWLYGPCDWHFVRVDFESHEGRTRALIQGILDTHQVPDSRVQFSPEDAGRASAKIQYCQNHRPHRGFLPPLAALPGVQRITPDAESSSPR